MLFCTLMKSKKRFYGYGYVDGMDGAYERTDPDLVAAVEALGEEANGLRASLLVVEIPDDVDRCLIVTGKQIGRAHV